METKTTTSLHRVLAIFALFCIALTAYNIFVARIIYPAYLVWNLFLAFVPYVFSRYFAAVVEARHPRYVQVLVFVVWLAFFPNALYLVTDFVHLYEQILLPVWFDIAIVFSYTWIAFFLAFLSLQTIEKTFAKLWTRRQAVGMVCAVLFLSSVGIYIGRYLRWNSWDVVVQPWNIIKDIVSVFGTSATAKDSLGMIVVFFGMFLGIYFSFRAISQPNGDASNL